MRCFGHWTDAQYQKGIEAARKDEREKAAARVVAWIKRDNELHQRMSDSRWDLLIAAARGSDK